TLTVTNNSDHITATAISAALPADWSDVTQDASACVSLAPLAQCTLSFTPGSAAHSAVVVSIGGQFADATSATLAVLPPSSANLTATGTPLTLIAGSGLSDTIVVTNSSTTLTATNIVADLTGTPLLNAVVQDASACVSVAPGASCSLLF